LDAVGREAAKQMQENFVDAGVNSVLWAPNAKSTLKRKHGSRPLTDTGALMNISHEVSDDGKSVLIGTNQEYGKYHLPPEKTGHESENKIPVRDWLQLSENAKKEILDVAADYLSKKIGGK